MTRRTKITAPFLTPNDAFDTPYEAFDFGRREEGRGLLYFDEDYGDE